MKRFDRISRSKLTSHNLITISYLVLPTGDTEMTELMEGVGDVGLEDAEDEADNGRIYNKHIRVEK